MSPDLISSTSQVSQIGLSAWSFEANWDSRNHWGTGKLANIHICIFHQHQPTWIDWGIFEEWKSQGYKSFSYRCLCFHLLLASRFYRCSGAWGSPVWHTRWASPCIHETKGISLSFEHIAGKETACRKAQRSYCLAFYSLFIICLNTARSTTKLCLLNGQKEGNKNNNVAWIRRGERVAFFWPSSLFVWIMPMD